MDLRRRLVLPMLATAGLLALPAAAQDKAVSATLAVEGNAPQVCALQAGQIRTGRLVNFSGTDGNVLRVQQFTDPRTLAVNAASAELQFAAVCNFPHRVRMESQHNGLWPTDGRIAQQTGGFAYAVPYDATLRWAEVSDRLAADAQTNRIVERTMAVDSAHAGDLVVAIEIRQGASNVAMNAPVEAGDFADTLRIYLEPR